MTKRQAIDSLRNKLRERSVDSTFTNQFLYMALLEHAHWLIKREISSGRIYSNNSLFQILGCQQIVETSTIEDCCPIRTKCRIYRTKNRLPKMWIDNDGPVIRNISSADNSHIFTLISPTTWVSKRKDPYHRLSKGLVYCFFSDGYLWFPEYNPQIINISGFYTDDLSLVEEKCGCTEKKECLRFLDTQFTIPAWLEAEMFSKCLEQMAGVTKRLPDDNEINKNPTRRD